MVDFARLVEIVLLCVSTRYDYATGNNFIQRAGICLLNALACQVEGQQKLLVPAFKNAGYFVILWNGWHDRGEPV